jgi:diguanylate cyclase (GGDEF)-like protein
MSSGRVALDRLLSRLPGWSPRRLSTRIVVVFLGLLLLVQLLGFAAVRYSIDHNARALLAENLAFGEQVWRRLLEQRAEKLTLAARVLAADWGFRTAVLAGDTGTLASALANHGGRVGASVSAMLTPAGRPLALGEGSDGHTLDVLRQLPSLPAEAEGNVLALVDGLPHQMVVVPMGAPDLKGRVVMGFALGDTLLQDMRRITGLEVAVLVADADGGRRVVLSTLPAADAAVLAGPEGGSEVVLGGEPHQAHGVTMLAGADGAPVLQALLLRSIDDAVAPYRELQATLAAITLGGLLLAGSASIVTARRVTTPLRALAGASERLGRGHYDEPLEHVAREDEIGDLAKAFDHMRVSIAAHESEIRQLAYWDRLTGLPNRARFRDAVRSAIAEAAHGGRPVAVVMLDLDRFKHVNDVLGYAFGDRLLKAVATRLAGHVVREGDLVARLSGDEFALLLPGSTAAQALAVAERIAEVFQEPLTLDDHTVDLAAGFGVACWPDHAADADALISRAEVAMYTAKRKTTSALVYDPAIDAGSAETLSLLSELRRALEQGELRLFLQPKVALASGRIVGAEALVRWQHPERGMVPPMQFIPFAEQTGFVRQLTLWMFEATARQWDTLRALGLERVSVNLSTRDLLDQDLPAKLDVLLRGHGVPARAFCLEITESAIMDEPQRAEATLNQLHAAGFKLSIDDFGTGYSSLAYLKRLPVDELKIDRSFVMAMETDEQDAKIVRSTIDLAHNLGLTVVAEGVESEAILQQLAALHCDEAQGYHMSRPMPAAELPAFAARWAEHLAAAAAV